MTTPVRSWPWLAVCSATVLVTLAGPAHADATPICFGRPATIVAQPGSPDVSGTDGPDVIVTGDARLVAAGGGDDRVCVRGSSPFVSGGDGDDRVRVDGTSDYVNGDAGDDRVWVAAGTSTYGGDGRDVVTGERGLLSGGAGVDVVGGTSTSTTVTVDSPGPDLYLGAGNPDNVVSYADSPVGVRVDLRRGRATGAGTDLLLGVRSAGGSTFADVLTGDRHANTFRGLVLVGRQQGDPQAVGADLVRAGGGDDLVDAIGIGTRAYGQGGDDTLITDLLADGGRGTDRCTATTVVRCEAPSR